LCRNMQILVLWDYGQNFKANEVGTCSNIFILCLMLIMR